MIEMRGDILKISSDAMCVTTNGIIRNDGKAVMGAGVARLFRDTFNGIDDILAAHIIRNGCVVGIIYKDPCIIAFPTKYDWKDKSSMSLIVSSAHQLVKLVDILQFSKVTIPRPGCSNGGLYWPDVRSKIENILDDRFVILNQ